MISVIIPLYNKEPIIARCLQSVLSQDYEDFEVIVVNDGSTDKSADIVRSFNDKRITLVEQENGGPSKARNTGVRNSKGEWIVFLDADDEFMKDALCTFDSIIKKNVNSCYITCSYYHRLSNNVLVPHLMPNGIINNNFRSLFYDVFHTRTGVAIIKKELVCSCPFNESYRRYEDFDVWFRMFKLSKVYVSSKFVLIENREFSNASSCCVNIKNDYAACLSFYRKSFWEKMCLLKLYLGERKRYKNHTNKDIVCLMFFYKILSSQLFRNIWK